MSFSSPLLTRKQPLYGLPKLPPDAKQNCRTNLNFATFHGRKIALADADAPGKVLLRHVETAELSNSAPHRLPVEGVCVAPFSAACFFHRYIDKISVYSLTAP